VPLGFWYSQTNHPLAPYHRLPPRLSLHISVRIHGQLAPVAQLGLSSSIGPVGTQYRSVWLLFQFLSPTSVNSTLKRPMTTSHLHLLSQKYATSTPQALLLALGPNRARRSAIDTIPVFHPFSFRHFQTLPFRSLFERLSDLVRLVSPLMNPVSVPTSFSEVFFFPFSPNS